MNAGRRLSTLGIVLIVLGTAGCAGGSGAPASTSAPPPGSSSGISPSTGTSTITIKDFAYGDPLTVAAGATVTITNMDSAAHTVTTDDGSAFATEVKGGGGTASFVAPTKPGTYAYHCTFHPGMHGTLVVK